MPSSVAFQLSIPSSLAGRQTRTIHPAELTTHLLNFAVYLARFILHRALASPLRGFHSQHLDPCAMARARLDVRILARLGDLDRETHHHLHVTYANARFGKTAAR